MSLPDSSIRTVRRNRIPTSLNGKLDRKLLAYASAAGAAGVAVLALAQPVEGEIIYTAVHKVVEPNSSLYLDVNGDGRSDFELRDTLTLSHIGSLNVHVEAASSFGGAPSNQVQSFAAALNRGAAISAGKPWAGYLTSYGLTLAFADSAVDRGAWVNVKNRFLGVRIHLNNHPGEYYYGWVRMSVEVKGDSVSALVTGYAYESVPSKPIRAGQTSGAYERSEYESAPAGTLGSLALGANGKPIR